MLLVLFCNKIFRDEDVCIVEYELKIVTLLFSFLCHEVLGVLTSFTLWISRT